MTDAETIEAARKLFASDTPGDKLARRLIEMIELRDLTIVAEVEHRATCEPPPREESPYKPLNLKQPAEYRPLVSMTRSKP